MNFSNVIDKTIEEFENSRITNYVFPKLLLFFGSVILISISISGYATYKTGIKKIFY